MAHLAVGFLVLALLALVLAQPAWFAPLLVIPILLSRRTDGSELRLPGVTFATLPMLTAATGGRVPNPYE